MTYFLRLPHLPPCAICSAAQISHDAIPIATSAMIGPHHCFPLDACSAIAAAGIAAPGCVVGRSGDPSPPSSSIRTMASVGEADGTRKAKEIG